MTLRGQGLDDTKKQNNMRSGFIGGAAVLAAVIAIAVYFGMTETDKKDHLEKVQIVAVGDNQVDSKGTSSGGIKYSVDGKKYYNSDSSGAVFLTAGRGAAKGMQQIDSSRPSKDREVWVAIGDNNSDEQLGACSGNILYSNDGIKWQASTGKGTDGSLGVFQIQGNDVAYGGTSAASSRPMWVAVGQDGTVFGGTSPGSVMYSYNGISWSESTAVGASFFVAGEGVAYGKRLVDGEISTLPKWVAAGTDRDGGLNTGTSAGNIMHSDDGIIWDSSSTTGINFHVGGNGVTYADTGTTPGTSSRWVAVGDNRGSDDHVGTNILYSYDGVSWSETTGSEFDTQGNGVAFGKISDGSSMFVAVGDDTDGGAILFSTDGIAWTESLGTSFAVTGNDVTFNDTLKLFVAVGDDEPGGTSAGAVRYSSNGTLWTASTGDVFEVQGIGVGCKY